MEKSFTNKVVLVTGGSFGIGRATAISFARKGAKVVIADCIEDNETLDSIKKTGGDALFIKCDVSDPASVEEMIKKTVGNYGRLDCAFNNAGIEGAQGITADCTEENWDRTIGVNLKGVWLCMKHEIPLMLKQGAGAIVNCASIAGLVGFPGLPAYVASKHGVIGLTKNAALEYAKSGIRVNAVCPGGIDTRMLDSLAEQATAGAQSSAEMMDPLHPMGRIGTPQEVADLIVWLCSPRASFITGTAIPIDGGYVAQ